METQELERKHQLHTINMCLYPKIIKNRKFTANKKNGGVIPAVSDKRTLLVPVGCGKCMECMKQKTRNWQVRLHEEIKYNKLKGYFVTLTFSNESYTELANTIKGLDGYELDNEIATKGVRRFLERWRKKHKKSVRHWLVTELGGNGTENIHLHGIIWTDKGVKEITERWGYGYTYAGSYVNGKTVNYIVKYLNKVDLKHKEYKPKILTSQGIGKGYINSQNAKRNKYNGKDTKEYYTDKQGNKLALPIYYRNAIYTEQEKEKLWISKLDEKKRWVGGEEVSIKENEDEYYKLLEYYRRKNKQLGYGDNEINWERRRYENERRNIMKRKRMTRKPKG